VIDRLSIAGKLFLMLLIPVVGLAVFAIVRAIDKNDVVSSMDRLEAQVVLAGKASALAHELQKERGLSAGYLASADRADAALRTQQGETDEAIAEFHAALEGRSLQGAVAREVERFDRGLQNLGAQRSQVLAGSLTSDLAVRFYSDLIASPLALLGGIADNASDPGVAIRLVSLESLVRMKELAGQERAVLMAILSRDSASDAEHRNGLRLAASQSALEQLFTLHASEQVVHDYEARIEGGLIAAVGAHRAAVITSRGGAATDATDARVRLPAAPPTGAPDAEGAAVEAPAELEPPPADALGVRADSDQLTPQTWWQASTARIEALFEVEHEAVRELDAQVSELRSEASSGLFLVILLAGLSIAAAVIISALLGNGVIRALNQSSNSLQQVVSQVSAFVQQQSAATGETAVAVAETTTTVEEIRKTAETAESQSREMSRVSGESRTASDGAIEAVSQGIEAMHNIRREVEAIARNILELSEKNIHVGEIVRSVNAIAEQSNLLAVNASIEAAKAGEHGRGFSVVAAEVKALAQQSKEATEQIRVILAEVQKSSNAAVMITEQGVKRVEEGAVLIEQLGRAIESLGGAIDNSTEVADQISLISSQQFAGIQQITESMASVEIAARQTAQGATELEQASERVRRVGAQIREIVKGRSAAA